jgi:hypothetical protein
VGGTVSLGVKNVECLCDTLRKSLARVQGDVARHEAFREVHGHYSICPALTVIEMECAPMPSVKEIVEGAK